MKIIQLIQKEQLRGAEIFACQLSNHLLQSGHEVMMVSLFAGNGKLPFRGEIFCLNASISKRFIDVQSWRELSRLIGKFNPDIVQANAGDTLKFASLSKILFRWGTPIVFRNANKVSDFVKSPLKLLFNKLLLRQVNYVVSVSEVCRLDFINIYGFPGVKTKMVPIGIEPHTTAAGVPDDLKHVFQTSTVILNVASLVPEKNHEALLRITKSLAERHPDICLLIAGDGKLRKKLEDQIEALGLMKHVMLLGYRSDVLSILPHAKVFVLPSLVEGLPGAILEAFSCNVPVVAYDVGGIAEILDSGTGWLVAKNDEKGFLDVIDQLLQGSMDNHVRAKNAYELAISQFSNKSIAQRFESIYDEVKSTGL